MGSWKIIKKQANPWYAAGSRWWVWNFRKGDACWLKQMQQLEEVTILIWFSYDRLCEANVKMGFGKTSHQVFIYLFIYLFIHAFIHSSMALQPFVGPWPLLQFCNIFYTDGRTPRTSDQPVARPLPTYRTTQTQNKCTHTSTPWVGFEPMIPAFELAKTIHVLDRAATVIGVTMCEQD
jgi:hypothetical protein